jgi:DNA uptake protein ComE-like DNA-binding protein
MSKVRINLANPMELLEIPGITAEQADTILRFRVEHGPIPDARALARVLGVPPLPPATCERLDFDPAEATAPEFPGG